MRFTPLTTHHSPLTTHHSPLTTHHSPLTTHHSPTMTLLDRFCRYVQIDTQANEASMTSPSTPGQLELGRLLAQELQAMGVRDAVQDVHGIVLATLPATQTTACPVIAWIAHVDTSPETSGRGVKPIVHRNYDGKDI